MVYLVAITWGYVVLMMGAAEAVSPNGSLLGAFFTLLLYGVLPLSVLLYLLATPARRRAQKASERPAASGAAQPDGGGHAPADAVAPEREEA